MIKTHYILIALCLFVCIHTANANKIILNEVVYSNKEGLKDKDDDTPDWIELFNASDESIHLYGYQLTDDTSKSDFWAFPDVDLAPQAFLIVFASGKNQMDVSELHANFKLSSTNDPLFLFNPDGELIDEIQALCVPTNASFGCKPDGSLQRAHLTPSPGISNNNSDEISINYTPDTLQVNLQSGFYRDSISVVLKNKFAQNTIRYTLDGDFPDEDSPVWEGESIVLNDITGNKNRFANIPETIKEPGNKLYKANILRAAVFSSGCKASNVISNIYFINKNLKYRYNVPIVSIITEKDNLFDDETGIYVKGNHSNYNQRGKEWERPAHIDFFNTNKELIIDQDAGIRISGQGSRSGPQKPLRLYAREKYSKEYFEHPVFPQKPELLKFRTLLLRSTRGLSGTLFKDELTQSLVKNMNIDYSGFQTVIVFINGEYWGIYSLRERLDEGYIENNFQVKNPQPDIITHALSKLELSKGSMEEYDNLLMFLDNSDPNSDTFYEQISDIIDIPELIDYFVAEMYLANYDFPHNNLKMWKTNSPESKWRFYFYDCDACMIQLKQNQFPEYTSDIEKLQIHEKWATSIFGKLLRNQQFRLEYYAAFNYHLQNTFTPGYVLSEIERFERLYEPLAGEHTYRWHQPEDYTKWKNNVEMLKIFAIQRPLFLVDQLEKSFTLPFKIYPNPSHGNVMLSFTIAAPNKSLSVYNTQGTILLSTETFSTDKFELKTDLPTGIYILQVRIGNRLYNQKIIIES